jgi:hypothetical protein
MFTKVNHTSTLFTGSLETEMGGKVYYGFDTSKGLMWLERGPHEKYGKVDPIWDEAESYLINSTRTDSITPNIDGPQTVTRSIGRTYSMGSSDEDEAYSEFDLEGNNDGKSALRAFETESDREFAKISDDKLIARANQLLQVGLEEY